MVCIAIDDDHVVYVTELHNCCVSIFTSEGVFRNHLVVNNLNRDS